MDLVSIISQALLKIWFLVPIVLLIGLFRSAWFKGLIGELLVNFLLTRFLDQNIYHLFKNVTLPTAGGTTQIDHILVSKFGVFVIETKNMKGWIFGSDRQKQWTQRIYRHTSKFQNPLHQNYKHIKTLESSLNISAKNIFSVIVFIGDSTFKTKMPDNVTYARECIKYIESKNVELLDQQEVERVAAVICSDRLKTGIKTNRDHVVRVRKIVDSKEHDKRCPKCGEEMMVREVRKGPNMGRKFHGCSTFPKCRATESMMGGK